MLRPSSLNATRRVARAAHTTAVRAGHELDVASLTSCLAAANVIRSDAVRPRVEQFSLGQSNPTYLLTWENDGAAYVSCDAFSFEGGKNDPFRLVLRKQPPGKLLRGAHAVDREYKVMSALSADGSVPVPAPQLFVDDAAVLGTPFFVSSFVDGRLFPDPSLAAARSPAERLALYGSVLDAICRVHALEPEAVGLGDFGRSDGLYLGRQTKVWSAQYRAAETARIAPMEWLMQWLPEALPDDGVRTTLVHGDLRVDNIIFAHDSSKVASRLASPSPSTVTRPLLDRYSTVTRP